MSRNLSTPIKTALAGDSIRLAKLLQFDFSTPVKITDYGTDIVDATLGTFTASSHILQLGSITETSSLKGNTFKIDLSAVNQAFVSVLLGSNQIGRRFRAWRAILDANNDIIDSPFMAFDGIIVGFAVSDTDKTSKLAIEVASHWTDFEKTSGRKTNANSQNVFFPNDRGMDFSATTTKEIKWGRK